MRKLITLCLLSGLMMAYLNATAHLVRVSDNATIKANISALEPTRISVTDDRIVSLRGVTGAYTYKNDTTQGAIFIKPAEAYQHKSFYIFIATEQNKNYVLLLTPSATSAGLLVLQPKAQASSPSKSWETSPPYETQLTNLIRTMVNGAGSDEYAVTSIRNTKTLRWNKQLNISLQVVFEGAQWQGEIYRIKNRSRQSVLLDESLFYHPEDRAIALQSDQLPAGGQTLLYKVVRHG